MLKLSSDDDDDDASKENDDEMSESDEDDDEAEELRIEKKRPTLQTYCVNFFNSASQPELQLIPKCRMAIVDSIMKHRPFESYHQLVCQDRLNNEYVPV
jgi:hypothetical protein